mgnify:CR=1 FL=1
MPNKTITTDQFRQIINNAPDGYDPRKIAEAILARGYQLEGLTMPSEVAAPQPSFGERHPVISGFGQGVKDIVAQPARAIRQIGQGLGNAAYGATGQLVEPNPANAPLRAFSQTGTSPVDRFLQYQGGAIEPTESIEQGVGQATQAVANLATPFTTGAKAFGVQGAVLGAGRAMEREAGPVEVGVEAAATGVLSYSLSRLLTFMGGTVKKGLENTVKEGVTKILTKINNIAPDDVSWASNPQNAPLLLTYINELANATDDGSRTAAQGSVKQHLLDVGRLVYGKAKTAAQKTYDDAMAPLLDEFDEPIVGNKELMAEFGGVLDDFGASFSKKTGPSLRGKPEADALIANALNAVQEQKDLSLGGIKQLKTIIDGIRSAADEGTPADAVLGKFYGFLSSLMDDATDGATSGANATYAAFKSASDQLKPIWSKNAKWDSALNFANALTNKSKTGSAEAMRQMEQLAGLGPLFSKNLRAFRVAELFSRTTPPAGAARFVDDMARHLVTGIGSLLGGGAGLLSGNPVVAMGGAALGATAGAAVGAKLASPQAFGKMLLEGALATHPELAADNAARQLLGSLFQSPAFQQTIMRALSGAKDKLTD